MRGPIPHSHPPLPVLFFNATAPTEIYTLSLHDALPIWALRWPAAPAIARARTRQCPASGRYAPNRPQTVRDRKSTRLNSSHVAISYAVFCLKKKKHYLSLAPSNHYDAHDLAPRLLQLLA